MANGDQNILGFTSAIALPELVGREELLKQIAQDIFHDHKRIVFLVGEGGIGKSRILAKLIKDWKDETQGTYVANNLIDFYLTNYHLRGHLVHRLYQVSDFLQDPGFEATQKKIDNYWIARIGGASEILRQEQLAKFEELLEQREKEGKCVVYFFDTAESIVYHWPKEIGGVNPPWADAWTWLLELVERHPHLHLVVAGRKGMMPLFKKLPEELKEKVDKHKVEFLHDDEMATYLEAVRRELEGKRQYDRLVKRLKALRPQDKEQLFRISKGIPIRLALMLDYLLSPGDTDVKSLENITPEDWEELFWNKLMNESVWLQDILIALGRLRKGANAGLLAVAMQIDEKEAEKLLKEIESYSFIKTLTMPDGEKRHFLHDEVYNILERVYYSSEDAADRRNVLIKVSRYYEEALKAVNQEIQGQYDPLLFEQNRDEESIKLDREKLIELFTRRHTLQVESVYYGLQREPNKGCQLRYRYTRDADLAGDMALDYALEGELLAFANRYQVGKTEKEEEKQRNFLERVAGVLAMRPVVRAWVTGKYSRVIELAEELRMLKTLFRKNSLNAAILNVWEAYARIFRGDPEDTPKRIGDLLKEALDWTKPMLSSDDEGQAWRAKAIRAFAYRVRAYYRTTQEMYEDAEKDYRQALALWETVALRAEIATTLNDGGYTLARIGKTHLGRLHVRDALKERLELAALGPVGLSVNTLALIQLLVGGSYDGAVNDALRAVRLFESIDYPRGIGLSNLALSEARRRRLENWMGSADRYLNELGAEEKRDTIREIAERAVEKLEESHDTRYYIKALIELGCVWRDMTKYCQLSEAQKTSERCTSERITQYREESKRHLEKAREEAMRANILVLAVEALVNLAWLGYYSSDRSLFEEAAREIQNTFREREDISIDLGVGPDNLRDPRITPENDKHKELWEQLGKFYMARGAWESQKLLEGHKSKDWGYAAEEAKNLTDEQIEALVEMGRLFTLALQYSSVRGTDYANFIRAQVFLYKLLRRVAHSQKRLSYFVQGISEAAGNYKDTAIWSFLNEWGLLTQTNGD